MNPYRLFLWWLSLWIPRRLSDSQKNRMLDDICLNADVTIKLSGSKARAPVVELAEWRRRRTGG